jgi:diguanylate cyclase (GGDEF)-like protein
MLPQMITPAQLESLRSKCLDLGQAEENVQESPMLFLLFSTSQYDLLPYFSERNCQPGEILVQEGEPGDSMYLIYTGKAVILKGDLDHPIILDVRQPGSIVGEMALLENAPRSATVVALQPMTLLRMSRKKFFELLNRRPEANQAIMSMLCARLRRSDEQRSQDSLRHRQLQDQVQALANEKRMLEERHAIDEKASAIIAALREQTIRDPLTGLYNRRYLEETLEREISRARRENAPVALIMMDIDYFKRVNDTYGHKGGDLLLQALGKMAGRCVRTEDIVCRYGGEEFAIVMPNAGLTIACERAEQIRAAFQGLCVPYEGREISSTLSLGAAVFPIQAVDGDDLVARADRALYVAKQSGRNRVVIDE